MRLVLLRNHAIQGLISLQKHHTFLHKVDSIGHVTSLVDVGIPLVGLHGHQGCDILGEQLGPEEEGTIFEVFYLLGVF